MEPQGGNPPPGWYQDPNGPGQRYWDGHQWTEHTEAGVPASQPQAQAQPAQVPAGAPQGGWTPATAGIRLGARLLDGLIVGVPFWIVLFAAGVEFTGSVGESLVFGIVGSVVGIGYFVLMETSRGQTLGKMILKLRVVGPKGGNPTPNESFVRNAWGLVSIVPFLGGLASLAISIWIGVSINNDPYGRGVHDGWAGGTAVLRGA